MFGHRSAFGAAEPRARSGRPRARATRAGATDGNGSATGVARDRRASPTVQPRGRCRRRRARPPTLGAGVASTEKRGTPFAAGGARQPRADRARPVRRWESRAIRDLSAAVGLAPELRRPRCENRTRGRIDPSRAARRSGAQPSSPPGDRKQDRVTHPRRAGGETPAVFRRPSDRPRTRERHGRVPRPQRVVPVCRARPGRGGCRWNRRRVPTAARRRGLRLVWLPALARRLSTLRGIVFSARPS
jgi:hypothetical protein